jgi:hypothetical protein
MQVGLLMVTKLMHADTSMASTVEKDAAVKSRVFAAIKKTQFLHRLMNTEETTGIDIVDDVCYC